MCTPDKLAEIEYQCKHAEIGCVQCKRMLADSVIEFFGPFRERRRELEAHPDYVKEVVIDGADRARRVARETLSEVKRAMNLLPVWEA